METVPFWTEGHRVPKLGVHSDGPPFLADGCIGDDLLVGQVREDLQEHLVGQLVDCL